MSLPNQGDQEPASFITAYDFPGGQIQRAVVYINNMPHHAYRLYRAYGSEQWWAPVKSNPAEAAVKLAYGRDSFGGRMKTAQEVWDTMLPYLDPIPQLDG
ncbi:MAG: hypothetical protein QM762_13420 [Chryseolinea sp.]